MARRREWRVPFAIPVRVLGISRSGQPYSGTAQVLEISRGGVRLSDAQFLARSGEVVTLQYRQRRAKFRVVWVGNPDGPERGLVGLQLLEKQMQIWGLDPGTGQPDRYSLDQHPMSPPAAVPLAAATSPANEPAGEPSPDQGQRRSALRYDCDRAVACWREGSMVPVWGKLRDLSANGCSVETPVVFDAGTRLKLVLLVYGTRVRVAGEVRSTREKTMGVLLTAIHRDDRGKFQAVRNRLGSRDAPTYMPVNVSDAVLRQIEAWFEEREVLSRDQLQQLLDKANMKT